MIFYTIKLTISTITKMSLNLFEVSIFNSLMVCIVISIVSSYFKQKLKMSLIVNLFCLIFFNTFVCNLIFSYFTNSYSRLSGYTGLFFILIGFTFEKNKYLVEAYILSGMFIFFTTYISYICVY